MRTRRPVLATVSLLSWMTGVTWGQTPQAELTALHERLTKPNAVISSADGRQALDQIGRWALDPAKLSADERGMLLRVEIYAALAVGDAERAVARVKDLRAAAPDTRDTLRVAWTAAVAGGDKALAQETLDKLKAQDPAKADAVAKRAKRLALVGTAAPDVAVKTDGGEVPLGKRNGVVLVLDFWQTRDKATNKHLDALRAWHKAYGTDKQVSLLGINSDPAAGLDAAKKVAEADATGWAQHFEAADPAPLRQKFGVDTAPWDVIIDGTGTIRAVGSAAEPELQYALRAAVAAAKGEFKADSGKATGATDKKKEEAAPAAEPEKKAGDAKPELRPGENPEAARLFNEIRTFWKTGKKNDARKLIQELLEKYPDTWEAREVKKLYPT